jgi:hypothetical protein
VIQSNPVSNAANARKSGTEAGCLREDPGAGVGGLRRASTALGEASRRLRSVQIAWRPWQRNVISSYNAKSVTKLDELKFWFSSIPQSEYQIGLNTHNHIFYQERCLDSIP